MKYTLIALLGASLLISGCATASAPKAAEKPAAASSPTIDAAKADLDAAKSAKGEWMVLDKSTGGAAVSLSKLLKKAEEAAASGDMAEADRLAAKVSKFAKIGAEQSKRYAGAMPKYN